ncbi:Na(+)-translocating NADH-quinone reductase subunit A [Psychroflexus sp. CAK57W]|uniref:Na(+)-translocating NADH-quinone reductase subunit A n=1 Tax=Psychroflexus curvus TaxID=2873595 RepID=UPI001CCDB8CC|nr:Na(+)-translocating NADH-quinone reductase subunit A [Psychroflexus curvus]MBZ9627402.1 Na(+)-translocating NADH-quinone reductase subunit A [Psychroflexus curvus]MBZ9785909.1 Na(+)-translocating NADH-quinone reductase subunit A [Psychroflexus curvus]
MPIDIKIKKGLTLKLKGEAENSIEQAQKSKTVALRPSNFHSLVPKMVVKEGAKLKAGDEVFFSKYSDKTKIVSPVSGTLKEIKRGAKRKILDVIIEADDEVNYKDFGAMDPFKSDSSEVKDRIFSTGLGIFLNQRPYNIPANAEVTPKAIYISAYDTAPLSASFEVILKDKVEFFQNGINALTKLTGGKVYLGVDKQSASFLKDIENVELITISGPHPAGNVGTLIHETEPMNRGEHVWTINPEDVAIIGEQFKTGKFNAERTVVVTGTAAKHRKYFKTIIGAEVSSILKDHEDNSRIISGNVLTGEKIEEEGYINFFANTLTVIPEGNEYRMFGWLPFKDNDIHSASKTSLSWLFPNKKYEVNTNLNGEERALVVTGEMEEVMPLNILPMQLLKACMAGDIEKMENLGIYEVVPEDFALVEYTNTSKIEAQEIIRNGLDIMITEVG